MGFQRFYLQEYSSAQMSYLSIQAGSNKNKKINYKRAKKHNSYETF